METFFVNIEWMPVLVSFVLSFGLGWYWYSDAGWGKKWREGIRIPEDDNTTMVPAMVTQVVATLFLAVIVNMAASDGHVFHAVIVAFTIALFIKANGFFSLKSKYAIAVETSFILVMTLVMVAVNMVM